MSIRIKNWSQFQHFKDRRPPWVKLYRDLLDDIEWHELDAIAAKALVMFWLIASETEGVLPEPKKLAFRLRMSEKDCLRVISELSHWLEQDDISVISERYQLAPVADTPNSVADVSDHQETERETEKEGEKKRVRAATPFLEGVSESLLADYLQVRKAKKAGPLTDTAVAGLQREATKANMSLCQAVTACVEFGWQGFNAGWYADRTQGKAKPGAVVATASHDPESRSAIEAEGVSKGIGPWNEIAEQWHVYKARVRGKPMNNLGLDALAAMAAQRSQAGAH